VALAFGSFAVAGAIFLILELNQPFSGLFRVPSAPIERAIAVLANRPAEQRRYVLDDRFHETAQSLSWPSIHGMRPFRASHMIRTLEALD